MTPADLSPENIDRLRALVPADTLAEAVALGESARGLVVVAAEWAQRYRAVRDVVFGVVDTTGLCNGGDLLNAVLGSAVGSATECIAALEDIIAMDSVADDAAARVAEQYVEEHGHFDVVPADEMTRLRNGLDLVGDVAVVLARHVEQVSGKPLGPSGAFLVDWYEASPSASEPTT